VTHEHHLTPNAFTLCRVGAASAFVGDVPLPATAPAIVSSPGIAITSFAAWH